jgi:hypothetical protein
MHGRTERRSSLDEKRKGARSASSKTLACAALIRSACGLGRGLLSRRR